jgi:iron complex outermembrane receptor protein
MALYLRNLIAGFLTLLTTISVYADITDSVHVLDEIEIQASRLKYYQVGASVHCIDSTILRVYSSESLASLLGSQNLAAIKTYGPGGQASISIRGGGSHHASVIWNNINIQSPMNGGINFSALPSCFIDNAYIQYGGASTLYGSGTATGSLHLIENLSVKEGVAGELSAFAGSAGNYLTAGKVVLGRKKWVGSMRYFYQDNANTFRYRNTEKALKPYENLEHGSYTQLGFAQSNKLILGPNSWAGSTIWLLDYTKEIPAMMNNYGENRAEQDDRNLMYSVYYKVTRNILLLKLQSGGFYNQVYYSDPGSVDTILNDNNSFTFINQAEVQVKLPAGFETGALVEQKQEKAMSGSYDQQHQREILSGIFLLKYADQRMNAVLTLREELVNGRAIPIVFSMGFNYQLLNYISFKSQLSKNYSLPTFNDLFWESDKYSKGNPDLKPESGWSGEGGFYIAKKQAYENAELSLVYFRNNLSNWIRWMVDSTNIWSPANIQEATSGGVEINTSFSRQFIKSGFRISARYSYTRARVIKVEEVMTQGSNQMLYVPEHMAYTGMELRYRIFRSGYNQTFVSKRTYDNAGGNLKPYTLGNLYFLSAFPVSEKFSFEFSFRVSNLWNTSYQSIKSYAMPLRQFQAGIKIIIL